jgi:hypothetical protein
MTAAEIAELLRMALSTVSAVLKRIGLGKRSRLEPPEPPNRYERKRPGELVHLDIKKLGKISARGAGHRITGRPTSKAQGTIAGERRTRDRTTPFHPSIQTEDQRKSRALSATSRPAHAYAN